MNRFLDRMTKLPPRNRILPTSPDVVVYKERRDPAHTYRRVSLPPEICRSPQTDELRGLVEQGLSRIQRAALTDTPLTNTDKFMLGSHIRLLTLEMHANINKRRGAVSRETVESVQGVVRTAWDLHLIRLEVCDYGRMTPAEQEALVDAMALLDEQIGEAAQDYGQIYRYLLHFFNMLVEFQNRTSLGDDSKPAGINKWTN